MGSDRREARYWLQQFQHQTSASSVFAVVHVPLVVTQSEKEVSARLCSPFGECPQRLGPRATPLGRSNSPDLSRSINPLPLVVQTCMSLHVYV